MLSEIDQTLAVLRAMLLEQMVFRKDDYFLVIPSPISRKGKRFFRRTLGGNYYTHARFKIDNPKDQDSVEKARRQAKARVKTMKAFERRDNIRNRAARKKKKKKKKKH